MFFLKLFVYFVTMKNIIILSSTLLLGAAVLTAAELSDSGKEVVVVVSLGDDWRPGLNLEALPVLKAAEYIAEPTGEVIPDFVPEVIGEELSAFKAEVFHPPGRNTITG